MKIISLPRDKDITVICTVQVILYWCQVLENLVILHDNAEIDRLDKTRKLTG